MFFKLYRNSSEAREEISRDNRHYPYPYFIAVHSGTPLCVERSLARPSHRLYTHYCSTARYDLMVWPIWDHCAAPSRSGYHSVSRHEFYRCIDVHIAARGQKGDALGRATRNRCRTDRVHPLAGIALYILGDYGMARLEYLKNVVTLQLNEGKCIACGMCIQVCPHAVLRLN